MRRLTLPLTILALALAPGVASAQGTLSGEVFDNGTTTLSDVNCDQAGNSTFAFQASGPASGPVEGTYSETGTVEVGPQAPDLAFGGLPFGQVLDVQAQFEIRSATGDEVLVTGSKRLIETLPLSATAGGSCSFPEGWGGYFAAVMSGNLCYDAVFAGGGTERGTAGLTLLGTADFAVFREESPGSPEATCPPLAPETKQECKKGGAFADSDQFANQGRCVSFVNRAQDGTERRRKK